MEQVEKLTMQIIDALPFSIDIPKSKFEFKDEDVQVKIILNEKIRFYNENFIFNMECLLQKLELWRIQITKKSIRIVQLVLTVNKDIFEEEFQQFICFWHVFSHYFAMLDTQRYFFYQVAMEDLLLSYVSKIYTLNIKNRLTEVYERRLAFMKMLNGSNFKFIASNAHFHSLLFEVNNEQLYQRFKVNLETGFIIRLLEPKEIKYDGYGVSRKTLKKIKERLSIEGIESKHIEYNHTYDEDGNYFDYCVKLEHLPDKKLLLVETIAQMMAFTIFESVFTIKSNIYQPTDEDIDNMIVIFWKIRTRYCDLFINSTYKSQEYDEDNF